MQNNDFIEIEAISLDSTKVCGHYKVELYTHEVTYLKEFTSLQDAKIFIKNLLT